jgi:hypothetical protein
MPDILAREVELLCAEFEQPGHRNVGFVAERLRDLLAAGHRLVDIEMVRDACDRVIARLDGS